MCYHSCRYNILQEKSPSCLSCLFVSNFVVLNVCLIILSLEFFVYFCQIFKMFDTIFMIFGLGFGYFGPFLFGGVERFSYVFQFLGNFHNIFE